MLQGSTMLFTLEKPLVWNKEDNSEPCIIMSFCSFVISITWVYPSTLTPRDYDSFSMAILSQNHKRINIAELILVNIKVVTACTMGFSNNDTMGITLTWTIWPPGMKSLKIQLDLTPK